MNSRLYCLAAAAAVVAAVSMAPRAAQAQVPAPISPYLYENYYVAPVPPGVGVEAFPSPRPTPALVGHTYITYEALRPNEYLYQHHRTYWRQNPGTAPTRTSVSWYYKPTFWPFHPSLMWSVPSLHTPVAEGPRACFP